MKKVLLYLPFKSDFYIGLYEDMRDGFEEAGCIVEGGYQYLESEELIKKINSFKPDFVFEMNRTKDEIENFPKEVIHICWLVDYWGRVSTNISGSDILYVFDNDWRNEYHKYNGKLVDVMNPGTNTKKYFIKDNKSISKSVLMLGHMPKPWTKKELDRVIDIDGLKIKFSESLKYIYPYATTFCKADVLTKEIIYRMGIDSFIRKCTGDIFYDLSARATREIRRSHAIENLLKFDLPFTLYGNTNWLLRLKFKHYYGGYLSSQEEMNEAYNKHDFLMHDSSIPHFRVFDAMSAGIIVIRTFYKPEDYNAWKHILLIDNKEIFTYKFDNFDEISATLTHLTEQQIMELRYSIRNKILQNHTWKHRAEKVLFDVAKIKNQTVII